MKQPKPSTSSKSASVRQDEAATEPDNVEVEEEPHEGAVKAELEVPSIEMPEDESKLPDEDKVSRLNDLYERNIRKPWLVIALWVILNVIKGDVTATRSKNPQKTDSFNKIANSNNLHPDLKGPVLRRWVAAGATWQDLGNHGVDNDRLGYSPCREIAKIPTLAGRISVGKRVVAESLTVKETIEAVKAEIAKTRKAADNTAEAGLRPLAKQVFERLDDPVFLSEDQDFCDILLDSDQVRTEFNFREQSKIYDKAEKIKKQKIREKSDLENRLEGLQQSINFLEDLMNTFDGKEVESETAA